MSEQPRRWTYETGQPRLDVNGVAWFACDPYPTWYRKEPGPPYKPAGWPAIELLTAPEPMPLTGLRLWRWKAAVAIYRIGCAVSGRHIYLMQWDPDWKVWACPHCGRTVDR